MEIEDIDAGDYRLRNLSKIKQIIDQSDLGNPMKINFSYKHKVPGEKSYTTSCFVILHN